MDDFDPVWETSEERRAITPHEHLWLLRAAINRLGADPNRSSPERLKWTDIQSVR